MERGSERRAPYMPCVDPDLGEKECGCRLWQTTKTSRHSSRP